MAADSARAFPPDPATVSVLPGATFADCFGRFLPEVRLTAEEAARTTLENPPGWISGLMNLRDRIVALAGLKGLDKSDHDNVPMIGGFPVVSVSPERVVIGFDDRHLDFRIVIDADRQASGTDIRATTLVRPRNLGGRTYLAMVMPFHKRIVPAMLDRIARRAPTT